MSAGSVPTPRSDAVVLAALELCQEMDKAKLWRTTDLKETVRLAEQIGRRAALIAELPAEGEAMNKTLAKALDRLASEFDSLNEQLAELRDEEQEQFDNLSEKAQEGEKGQALQENIDSLSSALDAIENAISDVRGAAGDVL